MRSADPLSNSKPRVLAPPGRCTVSAIRQGRVGCTQGPLPTDAGSWGLSEEELRQDLIRECSGGGVGRCARQREPCEQDHPRCDWEPRGDSKAGSGGFVGTEGQEPGVHAEAVPGAKSLGCQVRCLDVI